MLYFILSQLSSVLLCDPVKAALSILLDMKLLTWSTGVAAHLFMAWSALRGIRVWWGNFSLEPSGQTASVIQVSEYTHSTLYVCKPKKVFHPHRSKQSDWQWWCVHSRFVLTQNCWWFSANSTETHGKYLSLAYIISGACFWALTWMTAPLEKP